MAPANRSAATVVFFLRSLFVVFFLQLSLTTSLQAGETPPDFPGFSADYLVTTNGIKTAESKITLIRKVSGDYIYRQKSKPVGLASAFNSASSEQQSHWRFADGGIEVQSFKSRRKGGDDDDNAHLQFDWQRAEVKNIGAGKPWVVAIEPGTLDILAMQLAMSLDLMAGKTQFIYPVAIRGRIKQFHFKVIGEEKVSYGKRQVDAIKVQRMDDKKDVSLTWIAPELNYLPVKFEKRKASGLRIELELKKLRIRN